MRQKLIARYRYIWTVELINAFVVFPGLVWVMRRNFGIGVFTIAATTSFCLLLIIGATFALLKGRDLRRGTQQLNTFAGSFRRLRTMIPILLVALLLIFVVQWQALTTADRFFGLIMFSMAALEYINYFHIQLMYDNRVDLKYLFTQKKPKRGLIAREFGW
ncbi:MAG TPA: hypothetical protein VHP83_18430 [Aggregatilineaceae bacterium]|nr:hypothetical protein [Aggregatilineaceae bacterium]